MIELKNYDVEIYFEPEERMTRDYPGCNELLEIVKVFDKEGNDVTDTLTDKEIERLADEVKELK